MVGQNKILFQCLASALALVSIPVYHVKTKHIDVSYHEVKEMIEIKDLKLMKVAHLYNKVDVLIKVLSRDRSGVCAATSYGC